MSDENSSFDDLMLSPFEPDPTEARGARQPDWWPIVTGIGIGAVAVLIGYLLTSGDSTTASADTTTSTVVSTTSAPSTTVVFDTAEVAFPPGFVEVTDMVGIKPEYVLDTGDQLVVAFVLATRRGFASSDSFDGGDWVLETASGDELSSTGITTSLAVPGGFSVQFAKEGDVVPETIRLVDRWELDFRDASLELPFTGVPFVATDNAVDLGSGITLSLDRISLGEFDGEVQWSLDGAGDRGGRIGILLSVGTATSESALYYERDRGFTVFDATDLDEVGTEGLMVVTRQEEDGTEETTVHIDISATLVGTLPADATFDLTTVPGLNR